MIIGPAYFAFPELDYFVSAEWGVEALEEATEQTDFTRKFAPKAVSNTSRPTIQVFPGLDHDFIPTQDVCTGAVTESEKSDELSPKKPAYSQEFQQNFQQWVLSHLGLGVL